VFEGRAFAMKFSRCLRRLQLAAIVAATISRGSIGAQDTPVLASEAATPTAEVAVVAVDDADKRLDELTQQVKLLTEIVQNSRLRIPPTHKRILSIHADSLLRFQMKPRPVTLLQ